MPTTTLLLLTKICPATVQICNIFISSIQSIYKTRRLLFSGDPTDYNFSTCTWFNQGLVKHVASLRRPVLIQSIDQVYSTRVHNKPWWILLLEHCHLLLLKTLINWHHPDLFQTKLIKMILPTSQKTAI